MQSVHESFTNTNITDLTDWLAQTGFYEHESHEICRRPTSARSNFTNWLAQTGFYEHESHESHELIIMTTNLTNWLVAQGRIMGTGFWISGDRLFFEKQPVPRDPKTCPRDSSVPVILKIIS